MRDLKQDPRRRAELATLVERHRRELGQRPDVSQQMRKLSESNSRNPIAPQRAKRSQAITLLLGVLAVVVMLACMVSAVAITAGGLAFTNQLSDPSTTAQRFYGALHQRNYDEAYSYVSSGFKQHLSKSQFTERYSSFDSIGGVIETFPVQSSTVNGSSATVVLSVIRSSNASKAQTQTLHLVKENNDWRIDSVTLGASTIAPSPSP